MAIQRGNRGQGPQSRKSGPPFGKIKIRRYGWIPDRPDPRDLTYAAPRKLAVNIPPHVDLRPQCPTEVYDQGQIGSCTANAIAGALEFDIMKQAENVFTPSRLFIYYNERAMEGTVPSDAGASIRDGIKSVAGQGDCPETEWPYDSPPADLFTNLFPPGARAALQPPPSAYDDAVLHTAILYSSVAQNLADMQGCLAEGYPFVFGFTVFPSFESDAVAKSGDVPMPQPGEAPIGGHAVMAVGYDNDEQKFICRNSWGPNWGDAGYFYMPYAYLLDNNLADDFWTIQTIK